MYRKIKTEKTPRRQRRSVAKFETTEEWALMKADLEKGIGRNEALQVLLTDNDKKKYGIRTRLSVARFIKKQLAAKRLPYIVRSFRRDEGDYIIVQEKRSQ